MKNKFPLLLILIALLVPPLQRASADGLPEDKAVLANGDYARELSEARQLLVWKIAPEIEWFFSDQGAVSDLSRLILSLTFEAPTKVEEFENLTIVEIANLTSGLSSDELHLYQTYVSSGRKDRLAKLIRSIRRVELILNNAETNQYVPNIGQFTKVKIGERAVTFGEAFVSSVTKPNPRNKSLIIEQIRILTEALEKQEVRQWERAEPAVVRGLPLGFGPSFPKAGGQPQ